MYRRSSITTICVILVAALASTAFGGDPLMTNTQSFRIPFEVDAAQPNGAGGTAVLFVAKDDGPFEKLLQVPAASGGFPFTAPADGKYAFAVRITDAAGQLVNANGPLVPELEVIVDTVAPRVDVQLTETGPGKVTVQWHSDSAVSPGSVRLEYAEGTDGRWLPIESAIDATGRVTLDVSPGTALSVRGFLTDLAGNEGHVVEQLVLTPGPRSVGSGQPAGIQLPPPPQVNHGAAGHATSTLGPNPFQMPAGSTQPPMQEVSRTQGSYPDNALRTSDRPAVPVIQSSGSNPADFGGVAARTVRSRLFEIAYQLEDVGPSGVSEVELFVTESNGQQWFRYGKDVDVQSPYQVDSRGEGTFGFAIRVKNGVGFSDPPPQPGEVPEIVVTVDETAPVIRFGAPQVVATGQGQISLNWQIIEKNPAQNSVRLEYATDLAGPWTPLFDWQTDQNGYQMPIPPNAAGALYFRLLARDIAGNVATAQTPTAVIIDQQRPRARLLDVQPAGLQQSF